MDTVAQINRTFPHSYKCDLLFEFSNQDIMRFYYPGAFTDGGCDGLMLKLTPHKRDPWIGVFGFGDVGVCTSVFTGPHESQICVISKGNGYIVSVEDPARYEFVKASPILGAYTVLELGVIVFHNYTEFVAYDKSGLAWRSKRISYDGITVNGNDGEFLTGQAWDAPSGDNIEFRLNLRNGEHEGGSYPVD